MTAEEIDAEIERRLAMPYAVELLREDDGSWFVRIQELPGCMTVGTSREDALVMIDDAMQAWLETALEDGAEIPEPYAQRDYSGRFLVRVPTSLHRDLVKQADQERVSLNQYVTIALARSVGREPERKTAPVRTSRTAR